jgi:hypothetical protein
MTRIVTTPRARHKRRKKPAKAAQIITPIVTAAKPGRRVRPK